MPVPTLVTDLSTTLASNSPAGSDNVFPDLDNYLRAMAGFIASIRDNSGNGWVSPYLPLTYSAGTANGVVYLNGSKVVATGAGLVFDGTNLGVGTSSPVAKLDVSTTGDTQTRVISGATNLAFTRFTNGTQTTVIGQENSSGNSLASGASAYASVFGTNSAYSLQLVTSNIVRATLDSSGNLGLGVTPSAWSGGNGVIEFVRGGHISNEGSSALYVGSNHYYNGTNYIYKTTNAAALYGVGQGTHTWYTAPSGTAGNAISFTQAMTLASGGNLCVGSTSELIGTSRRLSSTAVTGNNVAAAFANNAGAGAEVLDIWNQGTTGDNYLVAFATEATVTFRGSITYNRAGGLVAYNTTSDYRAKDIIGPVQNPGATIDALKVYEGKMKGATQSRPMLVAHEAQAVAPYAVTGEKDAVNEDGSPKFQQMDVSSLVPLLLAEIQSLRARVTALEAA